jgi:hypothetical protein
MKIVYQAQQSRTNLQYIPIWNSNKFEILNKQYTDTIGMLQMALLLQIPTDQSVATA